MILKSIILYISKRNICSNKINRLIVFIKFDACSIKVIYLLTKIRKANMLRFRISNRFDLTPKAHLLTLTLEFVTKSTS